MSNNNKPAWMDKAEKDARSTGGERITPGGHKCTIKMVEPAKSKSGLDMYIVYFDTAGEDPQPYFFKQRYEKDTRDSKVWGGRMWLVVDENAVSQTKTGASFYGQTNLARITTAVEDSNGSGTDWKADYRTKEFCKQFAGKKVGVVFREEEYSDPNTHEIRLAVKPMRLCDYNKALEQEAPKRKNLPGGEAQTWSAPDQNGFMHLNDALEDEGLPFNV